MDHLEDPMRAHDKPGKSNPYANLLALLGIGLLATGLALTFAEADEDLIPVGAVLTNIGTLMFVGWLVAEALLWRPSVREKSQP